MNAELHTGEQPIFKGLHLDTCANRSSVMSIAQYKAYCEEFRVPSRIDKSKRSTLLGIGGSSSTIGTATIPVPFKNLQLTIDVDFKIVRDNVPTLLSNKDMIVNGLDISLQDKVVKLGNKTQPLILENYFFIHKWKPSDISHSMYTEPELRQLHRSFGHPSVTALTNLLRRARPDEVSESVRKQIDDLTKQCIVCAENAGKPRRFKITVGTSDLRFNHTVAVDIMFIQSRAVLHVVDEATHFCAALFLTSHKSSDVWQALLRCWNRLYLGPPDFLRVDQGSNFVSKEFLDLSEAEGITVLQAPIESPSTMSHVERYHAPLRAAYNKIRTDLPKTETDKDCLQMAVKSVNDTIGPEGLCPTLLVFGAIPRLASRQPATSQLARAKAIDKAMDAVHKEQCKRKVAFGLKKICHPIGNESSEKLRQLPAGSPVLVYRNKTKGWEGPFTFIHIQGETAVIQLPSGRKIFRSNVIKPITESTFKDATNISNNTTDDDDHAMVTHATGNRISNRIQVKVHPNTNHDFLESRQLELDGLLGRGVFRVVHKSVVPKEMRVYGTRWVDELKTVDGVEIHKSRLIAQNYKDKQATVLATKSPTISRVGQRLAIALAPMFPQHQSYVRDISQAYVQSESSLDRKVFLRPPAEMGLADDELIEAVKPLYGIPESGLHWYKTYHSHHCNTLQMTPTTFDPCLLFRKGNSAAEGVCIMQVDDSFGHGVSSFLEVEESKSRRFKTKPRKVLTEGSSTDFNGCQITILPENVYMLHQRDKLKSISVPITSQELKSVRAQIAYIGQFTRPDLCASVQLLASQISKPTSDTYKRIESCVERCKTTHEIGLKFKRLNVNELRLALFTDASFANTDNFKSQIGFVIVLTDDSNTGNIIHYGSSRCRRVTRSVMAAEILGLSYGFDNAFVTRHMLNEILGQEIPIDIYIDSRTVFNVIAKHASTSEKRLQIDVSALREAHDKKIIRSISWIPSNQNVADAMTKGNVPDTHSLWKLMTSNELQIKPTGWIAPMQP